MMFAFPKQQQKSCCVLEHAPARRAWRAFPCTMMACYQPLCALKKCCLCICAASRPSRCLCDDEKVKYLMRSCWNCCLMTLTAWMAGKMCDALDQTEDAQTTSILAVLRNLRFADKLPSSYVSLLIHLHFPLISEVRFCSFHWNERTTDRIV